MITPEEKTVLVQRQVNSKIRWGADREEVAQWLLEKHNVVDEDADQMLERAFRARQRALREAAYVRIAISFAGLALAAAFFSAPFLGVYFYGSWAVSATIFATLLGVVSLSVFVRNLARLSAGDAPGAVD